MTRIIRESAREFNRRHYVESAPLWNVWNVTFGHWALAEHLESRGAVEIELPNLQRGREDAYEVRLVPPGDKDDRGRCPW